MIDIGPAIDEFRDTQAEFYSDLKQGRADIHDFERHIYGQHARGAAYRKDGQDDDKAKDIKE